MKPTTVTKRIEMKPTTVTKGIEMKPTTVTGYVKCCKEMDQIFKERKIRY